MSHLNDVVSIEYRQGHVYHVTFDDGLEADVDFAEYVGRGPAFEPLRDTAFFQQARIEGGTIAWPNGADIAPETLYEKVEHAAKRLERTGQKARWMPHRTDSKTDRRAATESTGPPSGPSK